MNELIKNNLWIVIGSATVLAASTIFASGSFKSPPSIVPTPIPSQSLYEKVRIQVLNNSNKKPLSDVQVHINSNAPVKGERTDTYGYVEFQAPLSSEKVKIRLQKDGFKDETFNFDLKGDINQTKEYYIHPIESKKSLNQVSLIQGSEDTSKKVKKNY